MRLLRTLVLSALLLCTASLWAQKTSVDWDHATNFAQFKTYMWLAKPSGPAGFWQQRAVADVDASLAAKGLRMVASGADMAVALHGATRTQRDLNTFYSGMGGWGWYGMGGTATTTENVYQVGTLVLDFFNAQTRKLVWRGVAQDTISDKPEKNQKKLGKAIDKMMKKFPPEQKD